METSDVAGILAGSTDLEGPVVPARRKIIISGNLPPNNVIAHVKSAGARRRGSSLAKVSADERRKRRGACVDARRWGHDDFAEEGGDTGADSEEHVTGAVNRQQAMNALEMKEWKKVRGKNKYKVARLNDKFAVGTKMLSKKKNGQDGEVENICRLTA